MPRIFISDKLHQVGLDILNERGLDYEMRPDLVEDDLIEALQGAEALIVRSGTKVTRRVLESVPSLKVVGRAGVGVDNIEIDAATRAGVLVMNTPMGNIQSAAEHAVALLLACARNVAHGDRGLHAGRWDRSKCTGVEVDGKILGIVGLGKVGSIVARMVAGFNMKILAYDPYCSAGRAESMGAELVEIDELLKRSDFVTLHVPLGTPTAGMINKDSLALMKPNARLINTARGGLIVDEDLVDAVSNGVIAGAALDVFHVEPLPQDSPLLTQDGITVTPHLGASTDEAQVRVAQDIAAQIANYLEHDVIAGAVNVISLRDPSMSPYRQLGECVGTLAAQLGVEDVTGIDVACVGEIAGQDTSAITQAVLAGYLRQWNDAVNVVNAPLYAEEMNIEVKESKTKRTETYSSLIRLTVHGKERSRLVEGTLMDKWHPRIVKVDEFEVDFSPAPHLVMMFYPDRPGMVGKFGTVLGNHNVNIAHMDVGRKGRGEQAVVILTLDEAISPEVKAEMSDAVEADLVLEIEFDASALVVEHA
jgi:D-3-phosphoglycerate dehydrogenase